MIDHSVSVVIPAYNEEKRIRKTLSEVTTFLDENFSDYELILVDDGSTDSTLEVAKEFATTPNKIKIISNPHSGKGYTVKTGILKANKDYILFSDADLATPIVDLKRFLVWITEYDYDIVIGSRATEGATREGEPFIRHLMGLVFNLVIQVIALRGIKDTQCGFKLFKKDVAHKIFNMTLLYSGTEIKEAKVTAFDVEVLFIANKLGYKIKEVPVAWDYVDTNRVSPVRDSIVNFLDVIKVRLNDIKGRYSK